MKWDARDEQQIRIAFSNVNSMSEGELIDLWEDIAPQLRPLNERRRRRWMIWWWSLRVGGSVLLGAFMWLFVAQTGADNDEVSTPLAQATSTEVSIRLSVDTVYSTESELPTTSSIAPTLASDESPIQPTLTYAPISRASERPGISSLAEESFPTPKINLHTSDLPHPSVDSPRLSENDLPSRSLLSNTQIVPAIVAPISSPVSRLDEVWKSIPAISSITNEFRLLPTSTDSITLPEIPCDCPKINLPRWKVSTYFNGGVVQKVYRTPEISATEHELWRKATEQARFFYQQEVRLEYSLPFRMFLLGGFSRTRIKEQVIFDPQASNMIPNFTIRGSRILPADGQAVFVTTEGAIVNSTERVNRRVYNRYTLYDFSLGFGYENDRGNLRYNVYAGVYANLSLRGQGAIYLSPNNYGSLGFDKDSNVRTLLPPSVVELSPFIGVTANYPIAKRLYLSLGVQGRWGPLKTFDFSERNLADTDYLLYSLQTGVVVRLGD